MAWHSLFEGIFVLSLKEKEKRQEILKQELLRVGMNLDKVQWISAMNGKRPEIYSLVKHLGIIEEPYLRFFTPGHLGCLASHYCLWLQLFTKHINTTMEDKWYLIMEDDTKFLPTISSDFLTNLWSKKPTDATFVKFHATYGFQQNPNLISTEVNEYFRKQTRISFSLMCYAIHSSCFQKLLLTRWKNHIDLFHFDGIYLVKTPEGFSQPPQTLYSTEGLFTEGICFTNHELDSDTVSERKPYPLAPSKVQQLYDSVPAEPGTYTIHMYDDFQPTGTCHIHFQIELKDADNTSL
jgi:GR25 family glycosyltransferase involved in LPS biosynthesis